MTYTEAMEIKDRLRNRQPVDKEDIELAERVVRETRAAARAPAHPQTPKSLTPGHSGAQMEK